MQIDTGEEKLSTKRKATPARARETRVRGSHGFEKIKTPMLVLQFRAN
jgi:hypothetical protein